MKDRAGRKNGDERNTEKAYEGTHKGYFSDRRVYRNNVKTQLSD